MLLRILLVIVFVFSAAQAQSKSEVVSAAEPADRFILWSIGRQAEPGLQCVGGRAVGAGHLV